MRKLKWMRHTVNSSTGLESVDHTVLDSPTSQRLDSEEEENEQKPFGIILPQLTLPDLPPLLASLPPYMIFHSPTSPKGSESANRISFSDEYAKVKLSNHQAENGIAIQDIERRSVQEKPSPSLTSPQRQSNTIFTSVISTNDEISDFTVESAASEHLYDDSVDHQHFIEIGLDEALNELLTTPDSASEIFEPPPRHHKHQLSPLPYETSARKNSASETLPSRKNSGTPGNYDWDAITANLNMIQSSMHNWDKIEEQVDTVISDLPMINTDTNAIGFNANGFFFDGEPLSPGRKQLPANTQMISPTQNHQPAQANHASNPFDSVPLNSKKSHG
jgi:hypothetical protein